jgi:hypothetical protein
MGNHNVWKGGGGGDENEKFLKFRILIQNKILAVCFEIAIPK